MATVFGVLVMSCGANPIPESRRPDDVKGRNILTKPRCAAAGPSPSHPAIRPMDVLISVSDSVPLVTMNGRLDGFGAEQFDAAAQALESDAPFWILDVTGVSYISSTGLRSVVELEKSLRARDGGIILVGVTRAVG